MTRRRTCKHCHGPIPVTAKANAEFCHPNHKSAWHNKQRRSQGATDKRLAPASDRASVGSAEIAELSEARERPRLKEPTDAERLLLALRARGEVGIHSHEIRKLSISGNPSQRVADLEALGHRIEHTREFQGRRPGVRYTLVAEAEQLSEAA
jgi:hypothetical protein